MAAPAEPLRGPEGYLPQRLYDLNTPYGTAEELKALCAELKAAGIAPIADIVINHRCADTQDENGQWRIFSNVTFPDGPPDDEAPGKIFDKSWGPWAIVEDDPNFSGEGGSDTGEIFPPRRISTTATSASVASSSRG